MIEPNYLPCILIGGGIIFVILFFHYVPFFLWLSAKVSGVRISLIQLFLMRIRNVPPYVIVPAMIEAHKAGLSTITRDELEAHYIIKNTKKGTIITRNIVSLLAKFNQITSCYRTSPIRLLSNTSLKRTCTN